MTRLTRRTLLTLASAAAAMPLQAQMRPRVDVWRDANCGCCGGWVAHLRTEGFDVVDERVASIGPYRQALGTPSDLLSCHAAMVDGWLVIEGHVPAFAIRRALSERPQGLRGLAVPAMPAGTPGMETPGVEPEVFEVIAWHADGRQSVWMRMRGAAEVQA